MWKPAIAWIVLMVCWPNVGAAELRVWTTTDTRRVLRADAPQDGVAVALAAARNEWRGFQILLRSAVPLPAINIVPADLSGPSGAILGAEQRRLYRQHQLELTTATYRNDAFQPGWYPDPLIPFVHPLSGEPLSSGRLKAAPFELPASETHGFWVDLYVPPGTPAGVYAGAYRVVNQDQTLQEIPVQLTVWDFELPATPSFQTALGSPADRMRDYYRRRAAAGKEPEPADGDALDLQCAELLAEHRVNATPPAQWLAPVEESDGTFVIPSEQVDRLREFIDRYHVNALQTPHPRSAVKDPVAEAARLRAWLGAFDRMAAELQRPQVVFFTYLKDEPNDEEAYRYVQQWGRAVRDAQSVVKVMVVEQTKTQNPAWGDLYGAVDIWCPLFPLHDPDTAAQRRALGEQLWCYTALCQREKTPWWHIDFPLLHYRVPAWMAWREHIQGILYWGGMSFWQQVDDPWTDPKTLDRRGNRSEPLYNGEGTIVYPGRAVGYDGIASSLRLKALRDSIQDYEYLALLERLGRREQADRVVQPIVGSFFQWNTDPAVYDRARAQLAELILGAK